MAGESQWPFDAEKANLICDLVADGQNLHRIGQLEDYPPRWKIYEWMRENKDFASNYARAREDRADWRAARIDDVTAQVLSGTLDPAAARVVIDAEKWQAGKEKPQTFGDKTILAGDKDNPLQTVQTLDIASLPDSLVQGIAELYRKSMDKGE